MKHRPYSLYKKQTKKGKVWYARFWNSGEQRYSLVRSTGIYVTGKRGRYYEADKVAREMLDTLNYSPTNKTVVQYLTDFWQPDGVYAKEAQILKKAPFSSGYLRGKLSVIKYHIAIYPGFVKKPLVELTAGSIKDWMLWLAEHGRSNHLIDKALQAIRVAVREGIRRDELLDDPTKAIDAPVFHYQEKGVLKPFEVKLLIEKLTEKDMKRALILGLCGLRMGEVRGLRYEDVQGETVNVQNNYVDIDGDKAPKCRSARIIFLPENLQRELSDGSGYVFPNRNTKGKPACQGYFRNLFIKALELIGISEEEQKSRFLSFHSLRHTFVTLGRSAGISDMMIQALAGHKSASMMNHYSHGAQIINIEEAREKYKLVIGL